MGFTFIDLKLCLGTEGEGIEAINEKNKVIPGPVWGKGDQTEKAVIKSTEVLCPFQRAGTYAHRVATKAQSKNKCEFTLLFANY